MMKSARILAAAALACAGACGALAQSKEEVSAKIAAELPTNNRGGISAANIRDVMNSLNGARGQPGGIADLGVDGKIPGTQMPSVFAMDGATLGGQSLPSVLAGKAPIDGSGNVSTIRGVRADSDGTNAFSVKPFWAFYPDHDLTRYANAFKLTTKLDGESWESATGSDCEIRTGFNRDFSAGMSVAVGDNIVATPPGQSVTRAWVYRVTQAGTLGPNLNGWALDLPDTAEFTSGTAKLKIINFANLAVKICNTSTIFMYDGAGLTWGRNENFHMEPQSKQPRYVTGIEQDFTNHSGWDCNLFSGNTCNAYNMFLGGPNRSTIGLNISSNANSTPAVEWGLALTGAKLANDAAMEINTSSKVAIGVGRYSGVLGPSNFSDSAYRDESTTPVAQKLAGTYGTAAIDTSGANITPQGGFPTAVVRAPGQQDCFAGLNVCQRFDSGVNQFALRWSGVDVLYLDGSGNLRLAGGASPAASTVAALPACNATTRDQIRIATDVAAATYNATVSGGGSIRIPVYCNGSAWTAH